MLIPVTLPHRKQRRIPKCGAITLTIFLGDERLWRGIGEKCRAVLKPLRFFPRKTHSTVLSQVPRPKFFKETSRVEPSPKMTTVTLTFAQRSPEVFGVYTLLYLQYRTRQLSHFTSLLYFRVQLQVSETSLGAWRGRPTLVFIIISNVTVCLSL